MYSPPGENTDPNNKGDLHEGLIWVGPAEELLRSVREDELWPAKMFGPKDYLIQIICFSILVSN